ncbi:DUF397 domain-containing protein [Actinorugispora endophytica]|uniref:Uncharacterized protein DUF397 n=1 Tax=Actinorugispora endophytica TaxID=1605990 RepID=A0A4R6V379_9ACTN|nr:DUF397 domain-containing protein [Actinorugispora endophytica]TDQ53113.1 uncharacterized protein DUF397 [Actinorugispora endophytica]
MQQDHETARLAFRKSSYSATRNECVEVADVPGVSVVRDTRNRDKATLLFPSAEWRAFLTAAKNDEL